MLTFKGFRQRMRKVVVEEGLDAVHGLALVFLDALPGWGYVPNEVRFWRGECFLGTFWSPDGEPYRLEAHGEDGVLVPAPVPRYALWDWVADILEGYGWDGLEAAQDARRFSLEDALTLTRHFAYGDESEVIDIINRVLGGDSLLL